MSTAKMWGLSEKRWESQAQAKKTIEEKRKESGRKGAGFGCIENSETSKVRGSQRSHSVSDEQIDGFHHIVLEFLNVTFLGRFF